MATTKEAAKVPVKAEYIQRGETLDYKNSGTEVIPADTVVAVGTRIGIAGCDIKPGEIGSLHMAGVFRIPKSGEGAIEMGTAVSFDGTGIAAAAEGAAAIGYAAAPSEAADKAVLVKLLG